MVDLKDICDRAVTAREYFESLEEKAKDTVQEKYDAYSLDSSAVDELKPLIEDVTFVVFSAAWCKDCKEALPVFMLLEEKIGLKVCIFGQIKTAPLDPNHKWAVPPSPPEINEWGATAIPWIEIFDSKGERIGTIIEKPRVKTTMEAEILHVLKNK
ncbi:MAG: hypothetical protein EAX95_07410 [Candidatus Thorarchaeota archaeon]|nr:hypothetical protein [Candidatus Thorarchaeota archaeon]